MSLKLNLVFVFILFFSQNSFALDLNKTFSQQNFIGTHNSFASKSYSWGIRNQRKSVYEQLKSGARGLMLDIHLDEGQVKFCHNSCKLTRMLLRVGRPVPEVYGILGEIKRFLIENPSEIILIRLEDYVGNRKFQEALFKAGLKNLLLKTSESKLLNRPLREMVSQGKRLIVFSDARSWEYILPTWEWFSENHWARRKSKGCRIKRGGPLNDNKILSINAFKRIGRRRVVKECLSKHKRRNSIVWLNFI